MSISEKINNIVDNFSYFDNWEDRYEYLIDLGKKMPAIDQKFKIEKFKIQGCSSNLWVVPEIKDKLIFFNGASDSVIVQGLLALFCEVYSGSTGIEILNSPPDFIEKINLKEHLGPSRSNGLNALIKKLNYIAEQNIDN